MSQVPEVVIKTDCDILNRRHRNLHDLLHSAKHHQREAEEAAKAARDCMEQYEAATRQNEQLRQWLAENDPTLQFT
jgi:thiamine kinase-like enzyme